MYLPPVDLMKSSMKRSKSFWVSNMEISRTSQKLHFRVTKKDTGLPFNFHVLNLFKSWLNLGFDQHLNGQKIQKKNEKPKHIVFLCHIVSIKVDKQGIVLFKLDKSCIYPLTPKLCLMKSSMHEEKWFFCFKHGNFKNLPKTSY